MGPTHELDFGGRTDQLTSRTSIIVFVFAWLVAALAVGATHVLSRLPLPPPFIAVALTILLLLVLRTSRGVQAGARGMSARWILAFHATRLPIGAYFLLLQGRGVLPAAFAIPAGWGDIVVGLAAIPVAAFCCPVTTPGRRTALLLWNGVGLIDILGVLANGARIFGGEPTLAAPFTALPLSLLPTFVVPLVIVTHVLLFVSARPPSAR